MLVGAMSFVGINIGALTVKTVALHGDASRAMIAPHQGQPQEVLAELLARPQFADAEFFVVSGDLGHVTEVDLVLGKLHYDFYYIKHFSPWLDVLVTLRTLVIMVRGIGAR